jgi:hypothetical protein
MLIGVVRPHGWYVVSLTQTEYSHGWYGLAPLLAQNGKSDVETLEFSGTVPNFVIKVMAKLLALLLTERGEQSRLLNHAEQ